MPQRERCFIQGITFCLLFLPLLGLGCSGDGGGGGSNSSQPGLLSAALTLHFTLHRGSVVGSLLKPFQQKLVGLFSLALWSSVILAGRAIADFDIRPA